MAFPWKWSITWATDEGYHGALSVPKPQSLAPGLQQRSKTDDDQEKGPPVAKAKTEEEDEGYGADEQAADEVALPPFG